MSDFDPPRRALLVAPADGESSTLWRSAGWPTEAAALHAAALLDTDAASRQVQNFVGFLRLGVETWAVLRGGLHVAGASSSPPRWREVVVFGPGDLARVRFDPLRLLSATPPALDRVPGEPLDGPAITDASAADDAARIRSLRPQGSGAGREALTMLLAAVLDAPHTLVTGSPWTADDIELLLLLLPPRLRAALTFHTYATSLPREPIPRLVMTQLDEDWPFERAVPIWGHRLPMTSAAIGPRALTAARALTDLLDSPARLTEAHEAYGRYADVLRSGSFDLLQEVERVAHYDAVAQARDGRDAKGALQLLTQAASRDTDVLFTSISSVLGSGELTAALAELLVESGAPSVLPVADRFLSNPRGTVEVIRALAASDAAPPHVRCDVAVQCARAVFRHLPADEWETGLQVTAALVELSPTAMDSFGHVEGAAPEPGVEPRFAARTSRRGSEADEFRAFLDGTLRARPNDSKAVSDAELFLGFLAVDASRCRLARWEMHSGGPPLVGEIVARTRRGVSDEEDAVEAVHWSVALIERVRLGQVDGDFLVLAAGLLRQAAPRTTPSLLRRYLDSRAAAAPWLLQHPDLRALIGRPEIAGHWAAAVERALLEAAENGDLTPVEAACQHLDRAGVQLHEPQLLQQLAGPLQQLVAKLLESGGRRQGAARVTTLHALLSSVTAPEAGPALRRMVLEEPEPTSPPLTPLPGEGPPPPIVVRPPRTEEPAVAAAPPDSDSDQPPLLVLPARATRPRRPLLIAAAVAVLVGGVLVANVVLRGSAGDEAGARAGGILNPATAIPPAPPTNGGTGTATAAPPSRDVIAAELAEARLHARSQDWGRVVEVLATAAPDAAFPEAFAYDSLLAASALRHALTLPDQDTSRQRLLEIVRASSTRALDVVESFAPGADELRLLRAEACIAGHLQCDPHRTTQDLILAARSTSSRVSARAAEMLARWAADQDTL